MSQFTVYRTPDGQLLIDCQSDALAHLNTRLVAPLLPLDRAPPQHARLNPVFNVMGERVVMVTQFMATVVVAELGDEISDLLDARYAVTGAIDMLVTGV